MQRGAAMGVRRISLNFAVFRSVFERAERLGAGPVLRMWRRCCGFFSRWWQIESLYRANAKYRPIWEPRFLCFPTARDLPRIARGRAQRGGVPADRAAACRGRRACVRGSRTMSLTGIPLIVVAVLVTAVTAAATVLLWSGSGGGGCSAARPGSCSPRRWWSSSSGWW